MWSITEKYIYIYIYTLPSTILRQQVWCQTQTINITHNPHSLILSTQSQRVQCLRQAKIKSINHTHSQLQIYVNKNSECQSVCHHVVCETEVVSEHWDSSFRRGSK